jgi:catechol-2,3-dioxygenase
MDKVNFKLSRVGTILLGVKDVGRAMAFYRDTLGLPLSAHFETFAFFNAIESLIPSPTKQTLQPSSWSFAT